MGVGAELHLGAIIMSLLVEASVVGASDVGVGGWGLGVGVSIWERGVHLAFSRLNNARVLKEEKKRCDV